MNEIIKKNGITFGIITGVILATISIAMYIVDLKLFVNNWIGGLNHIIIIGLGIANVSKSKKQLNGFINFKEAFSSFFICIAIGIGILILVNSILFNIIDPAAKEIITEHVIDYTVNMLKGLGVPTEAIKAGVEEIQKTDSFGYYGQFKSYISQLVIYSIVGLIVAAIFKSKTKEQF